jgi:very-long-chain enoyl-CoA reductase
MPQRNVFKNCGYYWLFAFWITLSILKHQQVSSFLSKISIILFFIFEILNFHCHVYLRNLRPKGSTEYCLPKGLFFDSITCPNYTFEILSWISFSLFSSVLSSYVFTFAGAAQMFVWAEKKRKRLINQYPEAKTRGRLTPFRAL